MTTTNAIAAVKALRTLGLPLSVSARMVTQARDGGSPRCDGMQVTCTAGTYTIGPVISGMWIEG